MGLVGFQDALQAEHGLGDSSGICTGETDYAYAAAAGRSGDGDDGVVEIHRNILVV